MNRPHFDNVHADHAFVDVRLPMPAAKAQSGDVCVMCGLAVCRTASNCDAAIARAEQLGLGPEDVTVRRFTADEQQGYSLYADDAELRASVFGDQLRGAGCLWARWISYLFETGSGELVVRFA